MSKRTVRTVILQKAGFGQIERFFDTITTLSIASWLNKRYMPPRGVKTLCIKINGCPCKLFERVELCSSSSQAHCGPKRETASQPCALLITSLLEVAAFTGIFFPLNGAPDQYSNGIVVAMSFGFSLGDFFAVGQLAWNVYKSCTRFTPKRPLMVTN